MYTLEVGSSPAPALAAELDALERQALAPNPFYGAVFLEAAAAALGAAGRAELLLVRDPEGGLALVLPLAPEPRRIGPLDVRETHSHAYGFLRAPLVRAADARPALEALLEQWWRKLPQADALLLPGVPGGPLHEALAEAAARARAPLVELGETARALMRPAASAEAFLAAALAKKRRKELARLRRRLAERGSLLFEVVTAPERLAGLVEAFLALEAEGWKGRAGSAMASARHADLLRRLAAGLGPAGRLSVARLALDGHDLALLVCLHGPGPDPETYLFKIAFAEAWAAFSPGVLLVVDYTRWRHAGGLAAAVDSCAGPDHPMIDRLWPDRRRLVDLAVFRPTLAGRGLAALARARCRLRARLGETSPRHPGEEKDGMQTGPSAIAIDPETFARAYPERPFRVRHRLVGHPLLTVERLLELARALPAELIEYNAGELPIGLDPAQTPRTGLGVEETIRRIRECRSWMVLKLVERDPAYRALLETVLEGPLALAARVTPEPGRLEGYVFLSSPGSVTPFHVDNEHNFLLQIAGTKTVRVWRPDDREAVSEEQLERYHAGAHRNLPWRDELAARAQTFELGPGDGLFIPITAPHWVQNGPEVSISLSVTFRSRYSDVQTAVYRLNGSLRRLGLRPRPFRGADLRDRAKWAIWLAGRRLAALHRPA
jgi:CelD/BcsL family acetyltransferase involved in cellulose biosynthesis/quercetin dioxygenase-like cupin family protein